MTVFTRKFSSRLINGTAMVSVCVMLAAVPASALPQNGQVVGGQATIVQSSPTQLTVKQSSQDATINWQSFSIGSSETTNFVQPSANAIAFNRVTGVDGSVIAGHLTSNGEVVIVNPNGMLFTKTAQVNVGGLVASTSGITDQNANAGKLVFDQGSKAGVSIVNQGSITAKAGGLAALVAPSVVNSGTIVAKMGKIALAAGDKWTLDLFGDNLVKFAVNDQVAGSVVNSGLIQARNGSGTAVQITANVGAQVVSDAINMSGVIVADGIAERGGGIELTASNGTVDVSGKMSSDGGAVAIGNGLTNVQVTGAVTTNDGAILVKGQNVYVAGSLNASARSGGEVSITGQDVLLNGAHVTTSGESFGGTIDITGTDIALQNSKVDASGNANGGTIHIGDITGAAQTQTILIDANSVVAANGHGTGGTVKVAADQKITLAGDIDATGSANKGGLVVTQAPDVDVDGGKVDVSSPAGNGTWIVKP